MIFHSLTFVAFFIITVSIYWRLPHRAQNAFLLGASYIFYGWIHPWFVLVMLASTTVDFWAGRRMEDDPARKKQYLAASLVVNLGMLGFFKYCNFFIENVQAAFASLGLSVGLPTLSIVLPAGISFYTFQALSYTIDVYKGEMRARRSPLDFALFVAFFPHLVAGPIMRAQNLLVQVEQRRVFSADAARSGLVLMAWGFFKKLVVADNVAVIANRVFAHEAPTFEILWAGVFAFGMQIYADFSAYSDIARGVARWFGFELVVNFDHPYIAHSPANFWRRWHISLSTWFRDYVYIPLGGNRVPAFQREINLLATFIVSGFWHGASWNFVLWGLYHGTLVVVTRNIGRLLRLPERWPGPLFLLQVAGTFVLMMGGWLFFRETNADYLMAFLHLRPSASLPEERELGMHLFVLAATWSLPLFAHDLWTLVRDRWTAFNSALERLEDGLTVTGAQALTVGALAALTFVLRSNVTFDFIYFQF
jgi:alginate O-acetyltransferase complex protein AlgI